MEDSKENSEQSIILIGSGESGKTTFFIQIISQFGKEKNYFSSLCYKDSTLFFFFLKIIF
jgi:uridine kinase